VFLQSVGAICESHTFTYENPQGAEGVGFEPTANPLLLWALRSLGICVIGGNKNIDVVLTRVLTGAVASIWKHPNSPFWAACFTVYSSNEISRWKRSVKTSDRKLALRIADALEEVGRGAMDEHAITSFVEKIRDLRARRAAQAAFGDVFQTVVGREIGAGSLRAFAQSWLGSLEREIAALSFLRYKQVTKEFVEFIGRAADRELMGFSNRDDVLIVGFRDHLADRLAPASVNTALKIVRQLFKSAAQRFKIENPAILVNGVKPGNESADRRRPFTLQEIGRILRVVKGSEWEGIVLFGLYTGQRLSDIAKLRWENIDLVRSELAITTRKTHRRVLLPLAEPLADYLISLSVPDNALEFIFPNASACLSRAKAEQAGALSNQFHDILAKAGLVRRRSHRKAKDGAGRKARRKASEISFHSFRHTATSLLKNAGVPQSVVMDIIGHESKAVSQIYTHVGDAEKRTAMATLPTLEKLLKAGVAGAPPRHSKKKQPTKRRRK
jgi:integrase